GGASSRAAVNLALTFTTRGDYARAEPLLRRVLQLSPDYPIARSNLAYTLCHLGRNEEAEKLLVLTAGESEKARQDYPRTWIAAANLARLRHFQKDDRAALAILDQAQEEYPDVWELISYKAELLREAGQPEAARQLIENFKRKNW